MSIHVALVNPEIPQNTGNVARTCAAVGATLHLVGRIGFSLEDRYLRRAGLDYWHLVRVELHESLDELIALLDPALCFFASAHGQNAHARVHYPRDPWVFFGPESNGLGEEVIERYRARTIRIPTRGDARSLNLSNAVAVVVYEILRQNGFDGLSLTPGAQPSGEAIV